MALRLVTPRFMSQVESAARKAAPLPIPPPDVPPYSPVELVVVDAVTAALLTPEEIMALPRFPPRHRLDKSVVYFLFCNGKLIYVGRALSAQDRQAAKNAYKFEYDEWAYIRCDATQRFVLEQRYIEFLQLPKNVMGKNGNSIFSMSHMHLYLPTARRSPPVHPSDIPVNPFAPAPRVSVEERQRYAVENYKTPQEIFHAFKEHLGSFIADFADARRCTSPYLSSDKPVSYDFTLHGESCHIMVDCAVRKRYAWGYKEPESLSEKPFEGEPWNV